MLGRYARGIRGMEGGMPAGGRAQRRRRSAACAASRAACGVPARLRSCTSTQHTPWAKTCASSACTGTGVSKGAVGAVESVVSRPGRTAARGAGSAAWLSLSRHSTSASRAGSTHALPLSLVCAHTRTWGEGHRHALAPHRQPRRRSSSASPALPLPTLPARTWGGEGHRHAGAPHRQAGAGVQPQALGQAAQAEQHLVICTQEMVNRTSKGVGGEERQEGRRAARRRGAAQQDVRERGVEARLRRTAPQHAARTCVAKGDAPGRRGGARRALLGLGRALLVAAEEHGREGATVGCRWRRGGGGVAEGRGAAGWEVHV